MSKADAQRAMREAKFARARATTAPARRPVAAAVDPAKPTPAREPAAGAASEGEHCGHKSMNGRVCTRAAGHPEKSHRYG